MRAFASILLCLCLWFGEALGRIVEVIVTPPQPTEADSLRVRVMGYVWDGCWQIPSRIVGRRVDPNLLLVDVYTEDRWMPGQPCLQVTLPYDLSCTIGQLPAGPCVLVETEHHDSQRNPEPDTRMQPVEVTAYVPVHRTTWGILKARYE